MVYLNHSSYLKVGIGSLYGRSYGFELPGGGKNGVIDG
jgi:hypothetical protein